jgi:hypothetical protein
MDPKLLKQIEDYLKASGLSAQNLKDRMDAVKASTSEFNRELINAQRHFASMNSEIGDLSEQIKNVVRDLSKTNVTSRDINSSFKKISSLSEKLKYDAQGISTLNKKELIDIDKKLQLETEALVKNKEALQVKFKNWSQNAIDLAANQKRNKLLAEEARQYNELNQLFGRRGEFLDEENNYLARIQQLTKDRVLEEERINKQLGISGKIIDGIVGSLGKLGISSTFFENLKEDMRDVAKTGSKWDVMMKGMKGVVSGIGEALKDPVTQLTLLLKLINFFIQAALTANAQSVALGKSLGYGADRADEFRGKMVDIESSSNNLNVTTKNLTEAFGELAKATGFAYEFTADQLETQIKLTKQVGLTAEEAAQVQRIAVLNGKTSEETYKSYLKGITATRNQLKVGIDFKATLAEAVMVSGQLAANLGNNPELIGKAIVTAKAFGMTLDQVAKSGEALLNWETSIENELKAELLTGKQLNLERARAAALAGDQVSLAEELNKNIGSSADFTKMNVLQQKALAEAVGMTADELANTLRKREEALASGKSLAQVNAEEAAAALERQNIQEKFNAGIEKLQSLIGNLLAGPLGSFIDLLSEALNIINYFATPLKVIAGIFLGIKATQLAINAAKVIETGFLVRQAAIEEGKLSIQNMQYLLGKQSMGVKVAAYAMSLKELAVQQVKLGYDRLSAGFAAFKAAAEKSIILSYIRQGAIMLVNLGRAIATAVAEITGASAATLGIAAGVALAAGATAYAFLSSKKGDDVMSEGGYGKRTLLSPEGAIRLNDKDTVIAGTDLGGGEGKESIPSIDLTPMIAAINEVKAAIDKLYSKDQSVNMDGKKVGSTLVQGSYKAA